MNSKPRKLKEKDKKIIASSQGWRCKKCEKILPASYEIDHIIPFSISSNDSHDNLQALCSNCHSSKSQRENNRINQFKKKQSSSGKILCWFCLDEVKSSHNCNKVMIDIENSAIILNVNEFDKFIYSKNKAVDKKEQICSSLCIKLLPNVIVVNNYFTDAVGDYSVDRIVKIIDIALLISKNVVKFTKVEIDMSDMHPEEGIPDELVDHIHEFLPEKISPNIFKIGEDIEYSYII